MGLSRAEQKALFRFNLIFPLLDSTLERGERTAMVEDICAKEYRIPYSKKTRVSRSTVWTWYRTYRREGTIDCLAPKGRKDRGGHRKLSDETKAELVRRIEESGGALTIAAIVQQAERDGVFGPEDTMGMGRLYQVVKESTGGYNPKEKDRRAYRAPEINQQWQSDAMHGLPCRLNDGRLVTPRLFMCVDNRSRLICNGAWYKAEKSECYMDCLWGAFRLRGLPKTVYYDNGACFRDERIRYGCAALGVQVIYAKPYSPQSKGVIERLNRTVRQQFLSMLPKEPLTLDELNARFARWVDEYNRRPHSALDGQSPLQCYLSELKGVVQAPDNLPLYFRRREERTVNADRTVSVGNVRLQVPLGYSGKRIEVRFFDGDIEGSCEGFFQGKSIGMLKPVDLEANYRSRRKQ